MKRARKWLFYTISAFVYLFVSTSILLFHGPYKALTNYFIQSVAVTRHAYLLRPLSLYTLSQTAISKYSVDWTSSSNVASTAGDANFTASNDTGVPPTFETVKYPTFTAQIAIIQDPKRVHVSVTKYIGVHGETVTQLTQDAHAILGINGGAFNDAGWRGTGGIPVGTTISNGKTIVYDPNSPVIGITANGQLVCGKYTKEQLTSMHVVDAVSFGPILVQDGKGVAPNTYGYQPRVAIGQRADGAIIIIVTSGRFVLGANDLGSTYVDMQNLMMKYGAVTAANLDGGSSATLVYQGNVINHPADVLGQRLVSTAIVVN